MCFQTLTMMILNFTLELLKQKTEKQKFGSRSLKCYKFQESPLGDVVRNNKFIEVLFEQQQQNLSPKALSSTHSIIAQDIIVQ